MVLSKADVQTKVTMLEDLHAAEVKVNTSKRMAAKGASPFLAADSAVAKLSVAHPRTGAYRYGTAGFRAKAETLDSVNLRMGMLAALRSRVSGLSPVADEAAQSQSAVVGVMITASHNPACDNGIKLVDPTGEMMNPEWEALATEVANADEDKLCDVLAALAGAQDIDWNLKPKVYVGRDTRPSSQHLKDLVVKGVEALGGEVVDFGLVTTPQLHWVVAAHNAGQTATLEAYYQTISSAFVELLDGKKCTPLIVDCANGVGRISMAGFQPYLKDHIQIEARNTSDEDLNLKCGAEHTQTKKILPLNFDAAKDCDRRVASMDGDADRLVYCFADKAGGFHLMDGDKIIALYSTFIMDLFKTAGLDLQIGIVQTAYANGASTQYMTNTLKVPVQCAKTGVKHLHHKAAKYDVGVYFEANGHGTVLFSDKALAAFKAGSQADGAAGQACKRLLALTRLVNQCVGDALSDMLLCEVILSARGWTRVEWDQMYTDLASSMLKVRVKDRTVVTTTNSERTCVSPAGLQDKIDELVASKKSVSRRSFVRPSGTEDVVRVYAEADNAEDVKELAAQVCQAVSDFCA